MHSNHQYLLIHFSRIPIYPRNLTYEIHEYGYRVLMNLIQVYKEKVVLRMYYQSCILNRLLLLLVLNLGLIYTYHHDNEDLQVFVHDVL